jgi:hypothetical protein
MRGRLSALRDACFPSVERETSECDSYRDADSDADSKKKLAETCRAMPQCGIKYIGAEIFMLYPYPGVFAGHGKYCLTLLRRGLIRR